MAFPPPTPKQARVLWFSLTALAVTLSLTLLVFGIWGITWFVRRLSAVLLPVALALLLAYILDPVVEFFVRKKIPRVWSIVLVFVLAVLIAGALIGSVLPGMIAESRKLVNELPRITQTMKDQLDTFMERSAIGTGVRDNRNSSGAAKSPRDGTGTNAPPVQATNAGTNVSVNTNTNTNSVELNLTINVPQTNGDGQSKTNSVSINSGDIGKALNARLGDFIIEGVTSAVAFVATWATGQVSKVTTWVEFLIGFVLIPIYLFYFLLEKKRINKSWTDYLPIKESKIKDELVFVVRAINECMIVFFRGQVLVAMCVGIMLTVAYLILGLNYAVLLGLVAGVLGIVPYLGTVVSLTLALTVAGIQFGDWLHPLIVLGIAAGVKLLEDLVIAPKIIGDRSGLHPLTIIIAVMTGTTLLGGFLGALLAIPLTAILRTLMFRYVWKHRPPPIPKPSA